MKESHTRKTNEKQFDRQSRPTASRSTMKIEHRMIVGTSKAGLRERKVVKVRVYDETDPCPAKACENGEVKHPQYGYNGEFTGALYLLCTFCQGTGKRDLDWFGTEELA